MRYAPGAGITGAMPLAILMSPMAQLLRARGRCVTRQGRCPWLFLKRALFSKES